MAKTKKIRWPTADVPRKGFTLVDLGKQYQVALGVLRHTRRLVHIATGEVRYQTRRPECGPFGTCEGIWEDAV